MSETGVEVENRTNMTQGKRRDLSASCGTSLQNSPFLPGDDEDVVEEEEVDLLARRPLEEDSAVLHKGGQLSALDHPPGGRDQREGLEKQNKEDVTVKK